MQIKEVHCFRAFSPKNNYLYLTTSTENPAVDTYMIFTVRTNVFVDEITYLVRTRQSDLWKGKIFIRFPRDSGLPTAKRPCCSRFR